MTSPIQVVDHRQPEFGTSFGMLVLRKGQFSATLARNTCSTDI